MILPHFADSGVIASITYTSPGSGILIVVALRGLLLATLIAACLSNCAGAANADDWTQLIEAGKTDLQSSQYRKAERLFSKALLQANKPPVVHERRITTLGYLAVSFAAQHRFEECGTLIAAMDEEIRGRRKLASTIQPVVDRILSFTSGSKDVKAIAVTKRCNALKAKSVSHANAL
jgi:hypothetical protein